MLMDNVIQEVIARHNTIFIIVNIFFSVIASADLMAAAYGTGVETIEVSIWWIQEEQLQLGWNGSNEKRGVQKQQIAVACGH